MFVSIYQLLSKLRRDLNFDFNEADAIEWAGEALANINAVKIQQEAVAFIEVKNHRCLLPTDLSSIIQVARDYYYSPTSTVCPADVVAEEASEGFVVIDCNGQPVGDYDLAYYRPYYDMAYNYYMWTNSPLYGQRYAPVRLADHTFFSSIVCTETDPKIYQTTRDEYTVDWPYLKFSFEEGQIALAYRRPKVDEKGYPLIPDHPSYKEAITRYIRYKKALMKFDASEQGAMSYLDKTERDWHWYCQQAKNSSKMPSTLDEWQDHLEQSHYLLPRVNQYYSYFGRLAQPEQRPWNGNTMLRDAK